MDGFDRTLLAFDTALNGCNVACVRAGGKPATRQIITARDQAAKLVPLIQDCMNEAGVSFQEIDAIITTIGPGSFTGLRIGLSAARSFSLSLNKPLIAVTTMQVAARQALHVTGGAPFIILIETKRSDYYGQLFDGQGAATSEPFARSGEEIVSMLDGHFVFGDAAAHFFTETQYNGLCETMTMIDPIDLLTVGAGSSVTGKVEPLYLRGADVSVAKNKARVEGDITPLIT